MAVVNLASRSHRPERKRDRVRAVANTHGVEDQFETWLSGSSAEAFALAKSFDPARMRNVQRGKDKEDLFGRAAAEAAPSLCWVRACGGYFLTGPQAF